MAMFLFTKAILAGRADQVFNDGRMQRDFTYVDDIVEGVVRALDRPAAARTRLDRRPPDPATSTAPVPLYNIGNSAPVELTASSSCSRELGRKAESELLPLQPGDVPDTFADVDDLRARRRLPPATPIEEGIRRFVAWYREYHRG